MTVKKATASNPTVQAQLATLTLRAADLEKKLQHAEAEKQALKKQNVELASVIENDLKADAKMRIMGKSNYKEGDLENLSIEQLQQIDETLSMGKGDEATFKSIRAGGASQGAGVLTVGELYGKSRKEILESAGEF